MENNIYNELIKFIKDLKISQETQANLYLIVNKDRYKYIKTIIKNLESKNIGE